MDFSKNDRSVWVCGDCEQVNEFYATSCVRCYKSHGSEARKWECSNCGTINSWNSLFCEKGRCGKPYIKWVARNDQ
jgi:hypothetical protein